MPRSIKDFNNNDFSKANCENIKKEMKNITLSNYELIHILYGNINIKNDINNTFDRNELTTAETKKIQKFVNKTNKQLIRLNLEIHLYHLKLG